MLRPFGTAACSSRLAGLIRDSLIGPCIVPRDRLAVTSRFSTCAGLRSLNFPAFSLRNYSATLYLPVVASDAGLSAPETPGEQDDGPPTSGKSTKRAAGVTSQRGAQPDRFTAGIRGQPSPSSSD